MIGIEFTYQEYGRILSELISNGYAITDYFNLDNMDMIGRKGVILRHDVDISLEKAVDMAMYEKMWGGVCSTYFILVSSDFYNPFSKRSLSIIDRILGLNHKVGLHFDESKYLDDLNWDEGLMIEKILYEKDCLERLLCVTIDTVSMHKPSHKTLEADLIVPGVINSYGHRFFDGIKYISDSYHCWKEDPFECIQKGYERIQLLTHPFWYNNENMSRSDSFNRYICDSMKEAYLLLEQNVLPQNVTLKDSFIEEGAL